MKHNSGFFSAFTYAGRGIWRTLRQQRNFRVHVSVALIVAGLSWLFNLPGIDWALVVLAIALVLAMEIINTAIEAAVDLASPSYHPLAAASKDAGAGAVLVAAGASVVLGLIVYGPYLEHFGRYFMVRWHYSSAFVIAWCAGIILCYALLWGLVPARHQHEGGQNRIGGTP